MSNGQMRVKNQTNGGDGTQSAMKQIRYFYALGKRTDIVFKELKEHLAPFGIARFYTDDWGAYERHLDLREHEIGKKNTQKIERKNLNFRTRIKRLTGRTICFSKSELMHDIVIGLYIIAVEFGIDIHEKMQV